MAFKTISSNDAARLADLPLDYKWTTNIGDGFRCAGFWESHGETKRIQDALEKLNIHGAADIVVGSAEWCMARLHKHTPRIDGQRRLQSAWAATVDPRYSLLDDYETGDVAPDDVWTVPEWQARSNLMALGGYLNQGFTCKVRQVALGTALMAQHLCKRDDAFDLWLNEMLETKAESSPRHVDDTDYTTQELSLAKPQELTAPSREDRLANLDPSVNPYLRPADRMAELGFVGNPYSLTALNEAEESMGALSVE